MAALIAAPWIAAAVPLLVAVLLGVLGRYVKPLVPWVAMIGPALVVALGVGALSAIPVGAPAAAEPWTSSLASAGSAVWFGVGTLTISVGWAIDTLAALMLLVVGVVALMVVIFSIGYIAEDPGKVRYFALLSAFTGAMTLLVIGDSFATLFIGWELVGACSYLLIGFWYQKPSAMAAAVKAFLTTRVGDVGLLFGLAVLWAGTGSIGYVPVMKGLGSMTPAVVTAAAVLLAIGAIGKSAQFPLHIWLPDAMEGPTPVSALIHAATMVAAGVFLVARTWPLFEAAPGARTVLLIVGLTSALGASLAAIPQRDIKKVLAYSTISQLGFMFAALGAGAWAFAFFHLITHAAFKALLFLTSGSVIHGSGTQDMREMGGLRREMPVTFVVWLVGVLALVGMWPLSGFFSKDAILDAVWVAVPLAGAALFATAFVTGVYSGRATRLTFFGSSRGTGHAHESPLSMLVPLVVLAVPAAALGFAGDWIMTRLGEHPEPLSLPISAVAVGLGLVGLAVGWSLERGENADEVLERRLGFAWSAGSSGFGWDALVARFIVAPASVAARILWAVVDRFVIDGTVEGSATVATWVGGVVSRLQNGDAQWYGALIATGVALMLAASIWMGR
jgi:NADH-quinone oxidoreductase subunit L